MWHRPINKIFFLELWKKIIADIKAKETQGSILVVAFPLIWIFAGLSPALLWILFLAFAFYDWDNRVIGVLAIFTLAACPILLELKKDVLAEQVAVYVYFFLVMTVILQIIEYKRYPERFKEHEQE